MTYDKNNIKINVIQAWCEHVPCYAYSFIQDKSDKMAENTLRIYINNINLFWDWQKERGQDDSLLSLCRITDSDATLFMQDMLKRFAIPTVLSMLSTLSSLYLYLLSTGDVSHNPFLHVKRPKQVKEIHIPLPEKEKDALLHAAITGENMPKRFLAQELTHGTRARNIAAIRLLIYAGIKVSELVSLDITDVDFKNHKLMLSKHNNGYISLTPSIESSIKDCMDMRIAMGISPTELALFTASQGNNKGGRISVQTINGLIKKYAIAAEIPNANKINPNRLRCSHMKGGDGL